MEILINATKVTDENTLEFVPNPKRQGFKAHARYEEYMSATTVSEYFELADKKYARADLRYDEEHGHLKVFNSDGEQINAPEE